MYLGQKQDSLIVMSIITPVPTHLVLSRFLNMKISSLSGAKINEIITDTLVG